ncbi:MAG TPA: FUSC family protein [Kofleriaceae bacterium]|nr:FUSC family protein [Kofleriaceae bacterium]
MQVDLERVKYLVREATRIQPGRPALRMGLRAGLAVAAPMLIASQIGAVVTTWATLGGFGVVLVDKGGAYRTRATAMIAATIGGAVGALVGSMATSASAALVAIAIGTGACAMAAAWTGPAVAVGNTIAVQLIVATTLPQDPGGPLVPALGFLAGGAWSMVLALFLWPVRVYRPARHAAERCVREVAQHAADVAAYDERDPAGWRDAVTRKYRAIRETLETARAVLAATRRGRRGEIGRGERLLVLVEGADQIFGVLIGIEEVIDNLGAAARAALAGDLRTSLSAAVTRLHEIADRVVVEGPLPPLRPRAWNTAEIRARSTELAPLERAELDHALSLLARVHEDVAAMASVAESLADERERAAIAPRGAAADAAPPDWLEALRSSLALDSAVLRHATRVAIIALLSVLVTRALDLQRGYWATLTAVLLLQPYLPATITRGLQRVGGTIAGGLVATAIAALIHDPLGIALAATALAAVSAAVLQLNYGLYALFLTPTFVLLAEVHARDTHLVEIRIANTLLGAGLAVAGALLLWPSRESTRTGDRLADALDGAAVYLREVFATVAANAPARSTAVIAARRVAGRAFNNADLSLDRLVAEGPPATVLEPQMTLATMSRRLAATLSAFGTARHVSDPRESTAILVAIGGDAERYLHSAADALRTQAPLAPYARHDAVAEKLPPLLAARVARVDLQLSIISDAAARTIAVMPRD